MSSVTRKIQVQSSRLSKDDIISLARIVDDTVNENNRRLGNAVHERTGLFPAGAWQHVPQSKPLFQVVGGTIELKVDSLHLLREESWPPDTTKVILQTPTSPLDSYLATYTGNTLSIEIGLDKSKEKTIVIQGEDKYAKATSKSIEDILEPRRRSLEESLHTPVSAGLVSLLTAFILVNYIAYRFFRIRIVSIWSDLISIFFALIFIAVVTVLLVDPVRRSINFLFPYVDFDWTRKTRLQRYARWAVGAFITLLVGGVLDILRSILFPFG